MSAQPEPRESPRPLPIYRAILLAADSSDHANRGISEAVSLAGFWDAKVTGVHVYAAKMHDVRFRQMEGGLPQRYREEQELEHQRDVHDDLITRGLSIITDSYLDQAERACRTATVRFARRSLEGKNYRELVWETNNGAYDLLVLGAVGVGAIEGSRLGSVCQRVVRRSSIDTLVIKDPQRPLAQGPIVVAVDGSPRAYGGLLAALSLANHWQVPVRVVAAFDPYFHYVAFNRIAGVLSEEAGKVFRFKEQEALHEEIIDAGLAKIYEGHLSVAESIAAEYGMDVESELLDGKPHDAIEKYVRLVDPSLLVIGKLGIHADAELDIGGNAENLLRNVDCAVLLSQHEYQPRVDQVAEVTTSWTREAEQRMDGVPSFVRDMARMAILRYAQEHGHTVITERIVEDATARLCPGHAERAMEAIVAARDAATREGEKSDDDPIVWSHEAGALLQCVADPSVRDNLRMRAEKRMRQQGARTVGVEHVKAFVGESQQEHAPGPKATGGCPFGHGVGKAGAERDESITWSPAANTRVEKVPEGFMRELTRQRIETFARRKSATEITPELIDEKYAEWAAGSEKQRMELTWTPESVERINRIPTFVRGMVIKEVERCARELGRDTVTTAVMERACGAWASQGMFHSETNPGQYS